MKERSVMQYGVYMYRQYKQSPDFLKMLGDICREKYATRGRIWTAFYKLKNEYANARGHTCWHETWGHPKGPLLPVRLIERWAKESMEKDKRIELLRWIEPKPPKQLGL